MSDREKAGLRGPVKSCLEGFTETIYDEAGRLLTTRHMNPGPSDWVSTRSYDEAGRLTKIMSGKAGEVASETLYVYDEKGRVAEVSVRNVKALAANPTPLAPSFPGELPNRGGVVVAMDFSGDPPGGGIDVGPGETVIAIHDDFGQWTELSSFDDQRRLRAKSVRKYDANGRIIEESISLENPALLFADRIAEVSGRKLDDKQQEALNKGLKSMIGGKKGTGVWYSYDSQGRIAEVCRRNIGVEAITEVNYNEHGDKSEERVTVGPNNALPAGVAYSFQENGTLSPSGPVQDNTPPELSRGMKYLHTYEYRGYDEYGNWTEMTKVKKIGPEEYVMTSRRTLTYHLGR